MTELEPRQHLTFPKHHLFNRYNPITPYTLNPSSREQVLQDISAPPLRFIAFTSSTIS